MRKKNKLSLWTFSFCKSYYLTRPWKWIKEFFLNLANIRHRAKYGFAYRDVWNFFEWWTTVGAEALRYLAEHGLGYPANDEWDDPNKWKKYLEELANKLDWCCASCDNLEHAENEYREERDAICDRRRQARNERVRYETTKEEQEIIEKYWKREDELVEIDAEKRAEILAEIGRILPNIWD